MIPIVVLYIIPAILSVIVLYTMSPEVTRGDLVLIILLSLIPFLNFVTGYLAGLVSVVLSQSVNDFFNTRIK